MVVDAKVVDVIVTIYIVPRVTSKEKCTTKAEFFIALHNHDCREVTSPS